MSEEPCVSEPIDPALPASEAMPCVSTPLRPPVTRPVVWMLGLVTLLMLVGFMLIEPFMHWWLHGSHDLMLKMGRPSLLGLLEQGCLEMMTIMWFFMLGGSFGSFLHCLEYRLPRGISIAAQGSSCPGCHTKIKAWHNVPVFGWLALRGRCAACGWQIPARYPLAELVFGVVFVAVLAVELIGGGCNLPIELKVMRIGVSETIWFPRWELIGYYVFHVTLMTFLLTWCLFAYDHFRVPVSLIAIAAVIGVICPLVWPQYYLLDLHGAFNVPHDRLVTLITELAGVGIGLFLGMILKRNFPVDYHQDVQASESSSTLASMTLVGLYLGWQAALGVAIIVAVFRTLALLAPQAWNLRTVPVVISITLATFVHLLFWRAILALPYWPGSLSLGLGAMGYPLLIMLAVEIARRWGDREIGR